MLLRLVVIQSINGAKTSRINLSAPLDLCVTLKINLFETRVNRAVALEELKN
jgi:hypothetical protein